MFITQLLLVWLQNTINKYNVSEESQCGMHWWNVNLGEGLSSPSAF